MARFIVICPNWLLWKFPFSWFRAVVAMISHARSGSVAYATPLLPGERTKQMAATCDRSTLASFVNLAAARHRSRTISAVWQVLVSTETLRRGRTAFLRGFAHAAD